MEMLTKLVKIKDCRTHPKNVRKGNLRAIRESLEAHGQYRPIVIQASTGHVIAGNHTFMAAESLGWDEILVTSLDVDDETAIRIMLVDNRTTELASNDEAALLDLLQSLQVIDGSGYDDDDLEDLLFKVEGNLGTMTDSLSNSEKMDGYLARAVKSIVLPYSQEEYDQLNPMIAKVRQAMDVETNSQLFAELVRRAHA
jgi:ParB-like chromosome segregation protein Spo0J